ncbi:hypothetical protein [Marinitenerispora sediminis]|uniref:hypothetical protein n=1 Tax=Marinitenerispora sediminis TaxID=1931232 RepID=UPI0011C08049|nr:hypothetical protein [Marinitenerispora sediminis]
MILGEDPSIQPGETMDRHEDLSDAIARGLDKYHRQRRKAEWDDTKRMASCFGIGCLALFVLWMAGSMIYFLTLFPFAPQ